MELEKHITDERPGISYALCGDYGLPALKLPEERSYGLRRFGKAKHRHLRKCHRVLIFNILILVGSVKMADRMVREMMGL